MIPAAMPTATSTRKASTVSRRENVTSGMRNWEEAAALRTAAMILMIPAPEDDADGAGEQGDHDRLAERLQEEIAIRRADRLAQRQLARPLGDRHQHDVHDADAAGGEGEKPAD